MSQTAILFPGQGAQYVGMGVALAEKYASVQSLYDQAAQILGFNLLEICKNGPAERINATDISQPALFCCQLCGPTRFGTNGTRGLGRLRHDRWP